jgi:hypothetical protein
VTNWNNRTIAEYDAKGCVTGVTNCAGTYPTNCGAVSYDYTNICAGGSIKPPTLTSNVLYDAALDSAITFTKSRTGTNWGVPVQASVWLRTNKVDIVWPSINWSVVPPGTTNWCSAGITGPHTNYVTWTDPSGSTATFKRVNWVCNIAKGAGSTSDAGMDFCYALRSSPGFGTNVTNPNDPWGFLDSGIKGDCITLAAVAAKGMQTIGIGATPDVAYPTVDTNATTNTCHPVPPIALLQVGPPTTPPPLFKAQLKYRDSSGVLNVCEGLFYITNPVVKGFTVVPPLSYDNATYLYLQILTTVATDQEWVWYGNQTNSDGTITVTNGVSTGIQVPIPAIP